MLQFIAHILNLCFWVFCGNYWLFLLFIKISSRIFDRVWIIAISCYTRIAVLSRYGFLLKIYFIFITIKLFEYTAKLFFIILAWVFYLFVIVLSILFRFYKSRKFRIYLTKIFRIQRNIYLRYFSKFAVSSSSYNFFLLRLKKRIYYLRWLKWFWYITDSL